MSFAGYPVTIANRRSESDVFKWVLEDLISRASGTILSTGSDQIFEIGTVFGQITLGAQTVGVPAAGGSNAGNGVILAGAPAADPSALAGTWKIEFYAAATNAGWFLVTRPDGTVDGFGKVGAAYLGGIKFTISDGSADFAAGDVFTVAVSYAAASGKYVPLNLAATDGSQIAAAINYGRIFVPANIDANGPLITQWAAVLSDTLIWPAGITNNQITAALAQLAAKNISTLAQV